MSPFFAAIFLHALCLANAVNDINFSTVYEWDKLDFVWPSGANSSNNRQTFNPNYVHLRYMAVFGERLFLSLDLKNEVPATLVWLPKSGTSTAPKLHPFPSWNLHIKYREKCDTIKVTQGIVADPDGRLWVLDDGTDGCSSKLWIFDLNNNDTTDRVHQFPDAVVSHSIGGRRMYEIVLDKLPDDDLAYIADYIAEHIIVYSRKTDKSWTVKTPGRSWFFLAVSPNREARQLYLSDRSYSNELYSVFVSELKNEGGTAGPKRIGKWREYAYRIVIDNANILYAAFHYKTYLSKWNISEPFREQRVHEVARLDCSWPFTFALDADDTLWMTERNESGGVLRHKLFKAAVGARPHLLTALPTA
ncbi:Hypothetical predicted protein [Cloeon dipterum]|uniref:Bee-milk protein n=1 Tax=Cloeon dipterum TaxID=197152 RepID=A0A8S1DS03_9INSE|nr:Hypothetical predicted protein [Cloeon dipterum]